MLPTPDTLIDDVAEAYRREFLEVVHTPSGRDVFVIAGRKVLVAAEVDGIVSMRHISVGHPRNMVCIIDDSAELSFDSWVHQGNMGEVDEPYFVRTGAIREVQR